MSIVAAIAEMATSQIAGRHLFYNNSAFDNATITSDKTALLPGETATFANYTSFDRGINGLIVDIKNLTPWAAIKADVFLFHIGNDNDPDSWTDAPPPTSIAVHRGAGTDGSDRVTLIWDDHAIENTWLQVTVLANDDTGLAHPDIFYFGNAPGESGNSSSDARVNAIDMLMARNNPHNFQNPADIDSPYDFNRDRRVNALDMLIVRNNQTHFLNALELIGVSDTTAPPAPAPMESAMIEDDSALLAWLYEFDLQDDTQSNNKPHAKQAIDELMATYEGAVQE